MNPDWILVLTVKKNVLNRRVCELYPNKAVLKTRISGTRVAYYLQIITPHKQKLDGDKDRQSYIKQTHLDKCSFQNLGEKYRSM